MKIHYVNLGMAKNATSWLFKTLMQSPAVDYDGTKEPDISLLTSVDQYNAYYAKYNIGLNFNPGLWRADSTQLLHINSVATHQTIIFRNPYSYANSFYNFIGAQHIESDMFIDTISHHFDYDKIVSRLSKNIMIILYDDIVARPQAAINQITDYLHISPIAAIPAAVNVTKYTKPLSFNNKNVKLLNEHIDRFQDRCRRDLSTWKINV